MAIAVPPSHHPQSQVPQYQALYRAAMKEAAAQGRSLMQRLVAHVSDTLAKAASLDFDEIERKVLLEASRSLIKNEPDFLEAFPQALLAEFAQAIAGDTRKAATLSFDSLELMGEEQMQESVDQMRMQQIVSSQVEIELAELNTLLCAAQGLKTMPAERSPLRPQVYVRSLRSVVAQRSVTAAVRSRWLKHMGDALGPELARAYRELSVELRMQGVEPAGFNTAPSRDLPAPVASAGVASKAGQAAVHPSTLLNLKELKQLLSGDFEAERPVGDDAADAPRQTDFGNTVPAAFEALQEMKQVGQVMDKLKQRQSMGEPVDPLQAQFRAQATSHAQSLSLEVVNLMVEKVANDSRLLAPVQQIVKELEPALLRLAMNDPRFFSDRKHPARQLLDQMTQRSLAWESVEAPGFAAFIEPLHQAVEVLLSTRMEGAAPFDYALKTLEDAWGEAQQRDRHQREKAVRALLKAEQRNLLAERIAKEMRERGDVQSAPREVMAFITGPWAQVLAQARLGDDTGASDPGGYAAFVADLLWSVQPRMSDANQTRLAKFAPLIEGKVRTGLATIDYPLPATQRFVDFLTQSHAQTMRAEGAQERPAALSTTMTREELEAMFGDDNAEGGNAWLGHTEAQQSGFVDTNHSITPKPLFQQTQPGFSDTKPGAAGKVADLPDAGLQPGDWVELMMEDGWGRYQVTWASPHRTLFMFSSAAGKQHSMTRRLAGKMLKADQLRLVSGQTVVDLAFDEVADEALRNSVDLKL